jgi:hypothetical protein
VREVSAGLRLVVAPAVLAEGLLTCRRSLPGSRWQAPAGRRRGTHLVIDRAGEGAPESPVTGRRVWKSQGLRLCHRPFVFPYANVITPRPTLPSSRSSNAWLMSSNA